MSAPQSEPSEIHSPPEIDFEIVQRGLSHRLAQRLPVLSQSPVGRMTRIATYVAVVWLPLAILSWMSGHAYGPAVKNPFFFDIEVHVRLLIALPLLLIADSIISLSLKVQARHLLEIGILSETDRPRYVALEKQALALRDNSTIEAALLAFSFLTSIYLRGVVGLSEGQSSWERLHGHITPAGCWQMLIGLPYLYFLLLRWLFVFLIWARFILQVSRLELQLAATHPDRTGGLGFLGWGLACFSPVLSALSAVLSAGLASEIQQSGAKFGDIKHYVVAFVVASVVALHLPLLGFFMQLARVRFKGLLEFGALVWQHDRAFDKRWLTGRQGPPNHELLGSPDVQSMSAIATCYEHINDMWLIPFDSKAFAVLVGSALLPMVPLVGSAIPLKDIFSKLGELLI